MKNLKKTLMIAGILSMVFSLFNVATLLLDIFVYKFFLFDVIYDSVCIVLSIATGIVYFVYMSKGNEEILKHKNVFLTLSIINIFNGLLIWIVAFWVEIAVNQYARNIFFQNTIKFDSQEENEVASDGDYVVTDSSDVVSTKLEELKKLFEKNLITEEEYNKMRKEIIEKYL